jgi:hypothetical protein
MVEVKIDCINREIQLWFNIGFESQVVWEILYGEEMPYGDFPSPEFALTGNCLRIIRYKKRYGSSDKEIIEFLKKKLEELK